MENRTRDLVSGLGRGPGAMPSTPRPRYTYAPTYAPSPDELAELAVQRIPKRFRWSRWSSPDLPRRVAGGARVVAAVREAVAADRRVVLLGPAGTGKTALACAYLAERIRGGAHRGAFVPDRVLLEQGTRDARPLVWLDLALGAAPLVLDNFGELYGAPAGSGLAAMRIAAVSRLLADRHDRQMGHLITTERGREDVVAAYGDGIARRVFEGATIVRLGGG